MIKYELVECFPSEQIDQLAKLLTGFKRDSFEAQFSYRKDILCCFAWDDNQLVGSKIGFQERPGYFESATGEVSEKYRNQGIAGKLLEMQHEWCKEAGYIYINTYTSGNNAPMLILNIKAGFEICGFKVDRHEIYNVVLQKKL